MTGSDDGSINVYSDKLVLTKSVAAHSNIIKRVLYVNGGYVLTASTDTTVKIWDTNNNWSLYGTYTGHTGDLMALISVSDTVMLSGGSDGNLRQWTLSSDSFSTTSLVYSTAGTCCGGSFTFSSTQIYGACYMTSLNKIALALANGLIQLYTKDVSTIDGKLDGYMSAGIQYGHATGTLIYDCVSVGTSYIATCAGDGKVIIWDVPNFLVKYTLTGHTTMVLGLKFWQSTGYLASGSWDSTVRLWNAASGTFVRSFVLPNAVRQGIEFLNNSNTWVIADTGNKMSTFSQANANALQSLTITSPVRSVVTIPGETKIEKLSFSYF